MARSLHKLWADKKPFTRRVTWYKPGEPRETIRLKFEDQDGKVSVTYRDAEAAQAEYDAFRKGELSVLMILRRTDGVSG